MEKIYKPKDELTLEQKVDILMALHSKDTCIAVDEKTYSALSDKTSVEDVSVDIKQ